jgi:hypothetical protein
MNAYFRRGIAPHPDPEPRPPLTSQIGAACAMERDDLSRHRSPVRRTSAWEQIGMDHRARWILLAVFALSAALIVGLWIVEQFRA